MTLSRRSLITGLVSLVASPAIVRASSLMPVKAWAAGPLLCDHVDFSPGAINLVADEYRRQFITAFNLSVQTPLRPSGEVTKALKRHIEDVNRELYELASAAQS